MEHNIKRHLRRGRDGSRQRQCSVESPLSFTECRKAHVEHQQHKDRVDHRDDLNPRPLDGSTFQLHWGTVAKETSATPALEQTTMNALRSLYVNARLPRRTSEFRLGCA